MAPYAEQTPELLAMADGDEEAVAEALEAGAAQLDAALLSGGYQAPVDLTQLAGDVQSRWTAWLSVLNRIKAAWILSSASSDHGGSGQSAALRKELERCDKLLGMIQEGQLRLPLPALAGSEGVGLFVVGNQVFNRAGVEAANNGLDILRLVGIEATVHV